MVMFPSSLNRTTKRLPYSLFGVADLLLKVGLLLEFYILTTSKVIIGQVLTNSDFIVLPHWEIRPTGGT